MGVTCRRTPLGRSQRRQPPSIALFTISNRFHSLLTHCVFWARNKRRPRATPWKRRRKTRKSRRKFSSFFRSLVIELDRELYGPDNHLVEVNRSPFKRVCFWGGKKWRNVVGCVSSGIVRRRRMKRTDFRSNASATATSSASSCWCSSTRYVYFRPFPLLFLITFVRIRCLLPSAAAALQTGRATGQTPGNLRGNQGEHFQPLVDLHQTQ